MDGLSINDVFGILFLLIVVVLPLGVFSDWDR
jgi:hypothetical protein